MAKNKIKINKNELYTSDAENVFINKIHCNNFFKLLNEQYNFTENKLKLIFESEIYTNETQQSFNIVLRNMKKTHGINITDAILCLECYTTIKKILSVLDGETKCILKNELSEHNNIVILTSCSNIFI